MFFTQEILSRKKNDLGIIWLMATLKGNKLHNRRRFLKKDISKVSVTNVCETVSRPPEPLALRLTAQLLYGIIVVHDQQVKYLLNDANLAHSQLSQQYSSLKLETTKSITHKSNKSLVKENDPTFSINFGLLPEIPMDLLLGIDADTVMSMSHFNPFPESLTIGETSTSRFDFDISDTSLNNGPFNDDNMINNNNELVDFEFTETGEIADKSKSSNETTNPQTPRNYNEQILGSTMIMPTLQEEEDHYENDSSRLLSDNSLMAQYNFDLDDIMHSTTTGPSRAEAAVHNDPHASSIEIAQRLAPEENFDEAQLVGLKKNRISKRGRAALFDKDKTWLDNRVLKSNQDDYILNMTEIKKRKLSQGAARKQFCLMAREVFVFADNRCDKSWAKWLMEKTIQNDINILKNYKHLQVSHDAEEQQRKRALNTLNQGQDEPEMGRFNIQFETPGQRPTSNLSSSIEQARNTSQKLPRQDSSPWSGTPIKYNIIDGKRVRDSRSDYAGLESPLTLRNQKSGIYHSHQRGRSPSASGSDRRFPRLGSASSLEFLEEAPEDLEWDTSNLDLNLEGDFNDANYNLEDINFENQFNGLGKNTDTANGDAVSSNTNLFYNYVCKIMRDQSGVPESMDIPQESSLRFQDLAPRINKDSTIEKNAVRRKDAASAFSHLLVLVSRNYLAVSQERSEDRKFRDIVISIKAKEWA